MPEAPEKQDGQKTSKKKVSFMGYEELHEDQPPTSYLETLANLFKGNVGTGCFAMADAIKNGGIILGPIITVVIAVICIQCMHMLVRGAEYVMKVNELPSRPDYPIVVELCFAVTKSERWRKFAIVMRRICITAICITQLGFCCVYFLFVSESVQVVLKAHGIYIELPVMTTIVLLPVWISIMVRQLKSIAILSLIANVCMIVGAALTVGYSAIDLPSITERNYARIDTLPLYLGTAIFAFEGIALVLPLQNAMKEPQNFPSRFGVLNVGMVLVSVMYVIVGFIGYWQYGEEAKGSLTLNLPAEETLPQVIIIMVAIGVMLGYPIQFFVAIQAMLPSILASTKFSMNHTVISELLFRTLMCLVTFAIAQLVPNLGLLLSLIGAVFCSVLVFFFPAMIELTTRKTQYDNIGILYWIKNIIIIIIALIAVVVGGAVSIYQIYKDFTKEES